MRQGRALCDHLGVWKGNLVKFDLFWKSNLGKANFRLTIIPGAERRGAGGQWGRTSWGRTSWGRTSLGQNPWGRTSWGRRSVGQDVVGQNFVGQDVTGAISLGQ